MGKVIQQELPFNWGVPTTQALVPISHYQKAEDNLANLIAGSATPVATLPVTTGGSSQSVHTVFNSNTGKYEVKLGDKVLKSFYKEKTAEEFVKRKGADILREQAPVGNRAVALTEDAKKALQNVKEQLAKTQKDINSDFINNDLRIGKETNWKEVYKDAVPMTHERFVEKYGWDPHTVTAGTTTPAPKAAKTFEEKAEMLKQWKLADKNLRDAERASQAYANLGVDEINKMHGIGVADQEADLLRRKLALQERAGQTSGFRDFSQQCTARSKQIAESADNAVVENADDIAKKVDWKKIGKYGLIAAGAAALIGLGVWAYKKYKDSKAEETTPETPVVPPVPTEPETPVVPPTPTEPETPVVPPVPTEPETPVVPVDPNSPVDADGKMTVKKGDGFWHLAERYLTDKFKNEPEKFANLSEKERNTMIHKKMMEIVELYRKQLEAEGKNADVRFEKRIINGKEQTVVVPVIHPGQKIQVVELDKAA